MTLAHTPSDLLVREYLRVSQDRSGTGKSPAQQHDEMALAASRNGWRLHPEPYRDTNRSASRYARKAREGFAELMADLEENTFGANALGIWESSRGSRRTGEWVDLVDLCEARGVLIWVMTHNRVYDPANARDRRSLLEDAVDSEYESAKIRERVQRDTRSNAERGRPHGKQLYGYQRVYDAETRRLLEVVEHPEQGPIVREAARRVLAGESFYAIAKDFNARGIPPRRPAIKSSNQGRGWTVTAIKQMLAVPAYAGMRQHQSQVMDGVVAMWPPLIDPDAWSQLQKVMAGRSAQKSNDWPAKYLLTGIAVCGEPGCGAPVRIGKQNHGKKRYDEAGNPVPRQYYYIYECRGVLGKTGFHVGMRRDHLDDLVVTVLLARVSRKDFLATLGERDQGADAERSALLKEVKGYQDYLDEVRAMASERMRPDLLFDQEARIQPKIAEAQQRLEALADTDPLVVELAKAAATGAAREAWDAMDLQLQRQVVRAVVTPRINRVDPAHKGQRGLNRDRVDWDWR